VGASVLGFRRKQLVLGCVDQIDDKQIIGWGGDVHSTEPVTVDLLLDGVIINSTTACQNVGAPDLHGGRCGWRFGMREIWNQISSSQKLEIRVADTALRTQTGKQYIPVRGSEPGPADRLLDLLAQDRVIDKFGRAISPIGARSGWHERVNEGFSRLRAELEERFGYTPFITYGLLLGFARNRAPIGSDHDWDLTYLSAHSDPAKVRDEFAEIVERLATIDDYWTVHPYKIVWHRRFSFTPSWIGPDGLRMSFGYAGDHVRVLRDDIFPLQEAPLAGMHLLAPRRPELVAEFIYGSGWRWPDAGWVWRTRWKNRPEQLAARINDETVARLNSLEHRTTKES
jgi:hypothetical protein